MKTLLLLLLLLGVTAGSNHHGSPLYRHNGGRTQAPSLAGTVIA